MITSPLQIHSSNRLFTRDGKIHRVKSVTAFKLLHLYSLGKDIDPFLNSYSRSNELIILSSTDGPNTPWGNEVWPLPSGPILRDFCEYVGQKDWDVEFVLITGNLPDHIQPLKDIVNYIASKKVKNITFEIANEPQFNKSDPNLLKDTLESSGILYSSGIYNDNNKFFGKYVDYHPARDGEWVRKFHDGLEYWTGGGPNFPEERSLKIPSKANEPIKPNEAAFNQLDYYTFGAGLGLFSAGGCFHCETAKLCRLPTKDELDCYNAFMQGMELFPPDAPLGLYNRPNEQGGTLRTYTVGRFMIRVRPVTDNPFADVYDNPLDTFDICSSLDPLVTPADPFVRTNDDMPKHSYDEMMNLVNEMNAVTKTTKLAQGNPVINSLDLYPIRTTAHLLWRWFFENYTNTQILDETRKRGNGEPI